MAASLERKLRAGAGTVTEWLGDRGRQVAGNARDLEARGRQVVREAIRTGRHVQARTESELRNLGRQAEASVKQVQAVVKRGVKEAAPKPARPSPTNRSAPSRPAVASQSRKQGAASEVIEQARAAVSGAVDEASFGAADHVSAGLQALATGRLAELPEQFSRELAEERAQDAHDARHYGVARGAGQVAGFAGSVLATGGVGAAAKAAVKVAPRAAQAFQKASRAANATKRIAPLSPSGLTTMAAGGGAVAGVAGQGVSDAASGRLSDVGDYTGAALGGATGGLVALARVPGRGELGATVNQALRSPMVSGGVEGAATSSLQGVFAGEDLALLDVARAARAGAVGGRVGDVAGKYGANALDNRGKERIGEALSVVKTVAAGGGNPLGGVPVADFDTLLPGVTARGKTPGGPGRQRYLAVGQGRNTRADFITNKGKAIEAKLGAYAGLSHNQKLARRLYSADQYEVLHWLPRDVGRAAGILGGAIVRHPSSDAEE